MLICQGLCALLAYGLHLGLAGLFTGTVREAFVLCWRLPSMKRICQHLVYCRLNYPRGESGGVQFISQPGHDNNGSSRILPRPSMNDTFIAHFLRAISHGGKDATDAGIPSSGTHRLASTQMTEINPPAGFSRVLYVRGPRAPPLLRQRANVTSPLTTQRARRARQNHSITRGQNKLWSRNKRDEA
jgi:hypothetical protein